MPVLKIITNLSRDKIPADFLDKATEFLVKLLEKDKKVCIIIILQLRVSLICRHNFENNRS